jgi:hypothetical protein
MFKVREKGKTTMRYFFSLQLTQSTQRVYRTALVAFLLGAILVFGAFSFAPPAHAAAAVPTIPVSHVKVNTLRGNSILVIRTTPLRVATCYNTPTHTVTIIGLVGLVEFIAYSKAGCSGPILCGTYADILSLYTTIINLRC